MKEEKASYTSVFNRHPGGIAWLATFRGASTIGKSTVPGVDFASGSWEQGAITTYRGYSQGNEDELPQQASRYLYCGCAKHRQDNSCRSPPRPLQQGRSLLRARWTLHLSS